MPTSPKSAGGVCDPVQVLDREVAHKAEFFKHLKKSKIEKMSM